MAEGQRLRRRILAAMGQADIRSIAALAREARIQRDTLYAWFRGEQTPQPETQERVARALKVRRAELWPAEAEVSGSDIEIRSWLAKIDERLADLELAVKRLAEGGRPALGSAGNARPRVQHRTEG